MHAAGWAFMVLAVVVFAVAVYLDRNYPPKG
jgi:hypothetical protein